MVSCRDYYFTTKQKLLAEVRAKKFLEAARVTVHSRPCNTSAAAAAAAPESPLSYWYGTSLATVREVAATGKLCVMSLDMQGAEVGLPHSAVCIWCCWVGCTRHLCRNDNNISRDCFVGCRHMHWSETDQTGQHPQCMPALLAASSSVLLLCARHCVPTSA